MKNRRCEKTSLEKDMQEAQAVLASLPKAAQQDMELEIKQFFQTLEAEIEAHRNTQVPGGLVISDALDREMHFLQQARVIATFYAITTEQACFALIAAVKKMGWL